VVTSSRLSLPLRALTAASLLPLLAGAPAASGSEALADRPAWTGDPSRPQGSAPRGEPADARQAIAERQKRRDESFKRMLLSPFTSLGVTPIAGHVATRAGGDEKGVEIDPNTTRPNVVTILLDDTGTYVTAVSGGDALTLRKMTPAGDADPAPGVPLTGLKLLGPVDIIGLGRFLLVISGGASGGQVSVYDPQAPARLSFTGLKWFEPNPDLQIQARFTPLPSPVPLKVATTDGKERDYYRAGTFEFTLDGKPQKLTALARSPRLAVGETLFIAFRDATSGHETYATGRYLDVPYRGPKAPHLLDFNRAINPYCSYSPWFSCPIPPKENTLGVPIRAGEMSYTHAP
jgi:uncharacterized protein